MTDEQTRLTAGGAELAIDHEHGCRISSLRIDGIELLRQGPRYGAFPMVPWCGRIEHGQFRNGGERYQMPLNSPPHAIHGTGRDSAWRPAHVQKAEAAFTNDLTEPWPYEGRVTQLFVLGENSLKLTMGVETYADSFPAQAGWHPWFVRRLGVADAEDEAVGGEVQIAFDPAWQEERGADHLPTGRRIEPLPGPWDDCFGMPEGVDVTLTWPGRMELRITSRSEWVVVYDEQAEAVCVEPQSGPPNGLNTLPRLVTPIDPLEISTTWSWREL
ncbi:aldose 1-epimerase [Streptomyces sp. NPDC006879]|uniref:aldose epimerase family protein n=1 Tax=Streptomyces sp. NPDC006879 TaxID=3364767 RepID=UPI0036B4BA18